MPQTKTFSRTIERTKEDRGAIPVLRDLLTPFMMIELTREIDSQVSIRVAPSSYPATLLKRKTGAQVDELLNYYGRISEACEKFGDKMSPSRMASIAELGYRLFILLFDDEEQRFIKNRMSQVEYLAAKTPQTFVLGEYIPDQILVTSDGINIPWEFIYSEQVHSVDDVNPKFFLGSSFFIQQCVSLAKNRWATSRPFSRKAGISIFFDDNLDVASKKEAPGIVQLFQSSAAVAKLMAPIAPNSGQFGLLAKAVNSTEADIIHFACHATINKVGEIKIFVRSAYSESDLQFTNHLGNAKSGAFIFLNACNLAPRQSKQIDHLVNKLLANGYSAVIATEIEIGDQEAWTFAELVYGYLLNPHCKSLQKAMYHARRSMMAQGIIAGYTYKFYGNIDLVVN